MRMHKDINVNVTTDYNRTAYGFVISEGSALLHESELEWSKDIATELAAEIEERLIAWRHQFKLEASKLPV